MDPSDIDNYVFSDDLSAKSHWLTKEEDHQLGQELHYLKKYDGIRHEWYDLRILEFTIKVLEKYTKNEFCELNMSDFNNCYLVFLDNDKEIELSVAFWVDKHHIKMQSKEFVEVPPKERKHWYKHQIRNKNIIDQ